MSRYFMLSVTGCWHLQQTGACLWSPLCEKIWIFGTYVKSNLQTVNWPKENKNCCAVFLHSINGIRSHLGRGKLS